MLSALPERNEGPSDDDDDDKIHRRMGRLSTQVNDIHFPHRFQIPANQELVLVTAKRKYLIAKSRFKEGYIESFGVLGAIIGGFSVILVYLCSASFRAHLFLDVPSAVMVGAIMGCMSGSLIGCVFAMASSQLVADANFTAIPSAQGASEQTGSQQTAFKQIGSNQTGSEQIASEQEGSTKLSAGAHIIPLTTKTTKAPLKSPRNNGSALG